MNEHERLFISDCEREAHEADARAAHARKCTAHPKGHDSPFARRCHALADALENVAATWREAAEQFRDEIGAKS
jgi:hypothetical protein